MNLAHSTALRTCFGGRRRSKAMATERWVDEMAELAREAGPHVSAKKSTGQL